MYFIDELLDAMNRGLFRSRMRESESLKIRIDNSVACENEQDLVMRFGQTIHQLLMAKVEQWMILLESDSVTDKIKTWIDSLTDDVRIVEDKESNLVMISNPDCTINGYREQWLMLQDYYNQ